MAAPVLQFKRGLLTNLPALRAGEPGFTTDSYDLYVGLTSETSTNKFFGSHRYWTKETSSTGSGVNLVEGTTNGSQYITLKSPDSLSGITTYTLPETPSDGYLLTTNASGVLSWSNTLASPSFSGNVSFTGTGDNTLGNPDTGAVQIDGGLGINKNVTIGAGLSVAGQSYFIGTATFYGGQINLGDSDTDDINVAGEFISNLTPNTDNTYDIGNNSTPKRWRHAAFSGIGTFATGAVLDAIQIGITAAGEIDTSTGSLTLDSALGQTIIDDNLSVTGIATFEQGLTGTISTATRATLVDTTTTTTNQDYYIPFVENITGTTSETIRVGAALSVNPSTNKLTVGGSLQVNGNTIHSSTGETAITLSANDVTIADDLTVGGNLYINGNTTQVNTTTLNVKDALVDLGLIDTGGGVLGAPTSDLNKDIGILFNYYTTSAKKSSVFWDDDTGRIVIASDVTENTGVLTVASNAYAALEVGSLYINDSCTGGVATKVIGCDAGELKLLDVTIDAGSF
jgi:hypothetical protein